MGSFSWIIPGKIAIGGMPALKQESAFIQAGIRSVLNLTQQPDPRWKGLMGEQDATPDDGLSKPAAWFAKGITYTLSHLRFGGVFIHCRSGVHRAPSMAYAVLRTMGFSDEEARSTILLRHPVSQLRYADDAEKALQELGFIQQERTM